VERIIIQFLSTIDIFDVTNDSCLWVGGECGEEAGVAANLLENDEAFALLTHVFRLAHMAAFEHKSNEK